MITTYKRIPKIYCLASRTKSWMTSYARSFSTDLERQEIVAQTVSANYVQKYVK